MNPLYNETICSWLTVVHETVFAYLNTPNGSIKVELIYKNSVDINVDNFTITLETIIFLLDPNNKTYIIKDFNINVIDYNNSVPL